MKRKSIEEGSVPKKDKGDPRGSRQQRNFRGGTGRETPEKGDKKRKHKN